MTDTTKRITVPLPMSYFGADGRIDKDLATLADGADHDTCVERIGAAWARIQEIKEEEKNDPMRKLLREQAVMERKIAALLAARADTSTVNA